MLLTIICRGGKGWGLRYMEAGVALSNPSTPPNMIRAE